MIENLSKHPTLCIVLSILFFFVCFFSNYHLLDDLLRMHRSKSAVKKLKKQYTFSQRLRLHHFKEHCCHAVRFCNRLIIFQKISWVSLSIYLSTAMLFAFGLFSPTFITWLTIGLFLLFIMPVCVIQMVLIRPFLFGRLKKYSFEKYHNTDNHSRLL